MSRFLLSIFSCASLILSTTTNAQVFDSIRFHGFIDVYYGKDQSIWNEHSRPSFLYSHTSTDHIALNAAVFELKSYGKKVSTHLALVEGTYANKVTSAEPVGFGALYVANVSLALNKDNSLLLTAGIFPSHIGQENVIGLDNLNLTRSLAAENSPYYESGVKLEKRSKNQKWNFTALALNGWQTMTLIPQDHSMSLGTSVQFQPNEKFTIASNTFYGEVPVADSTLKRLFHNLQFNYSSNSWTVQGQWDVGLQNENLWHVGFIGLGKDLTDKLQLNARVEYIQDAQNSVMNSPTNEVFAGSAGMRWRISPQTNFRAEYRNLNSFGPESFAFKNSNSKQIHGLTLSLAAQF
ncbi:MAG: outer membrane beta-barrel protein [Bacteroidota bacterium]